MFSDVERSPSWHSPPLAADFGPHPYASTTPGSGGRPPVQSGWFPLQDATSSSTVDPSRTTNDMYTDHSMLSPPANRPLQHPAPWPASPAGPFVDNRPRGPYGAFHPSPTGAPTTPSGYSPLYGYGGTPMAGDAGNVGGFGWQDERPMAPPSIHTTGLELLRMPYDDMHRVHAAAHGMHAMMGGAGPMGYGRYGMSSSPALRKKHKEISIGRWTSDEHRIFLKGLEMYQGPSWGEIARMIGTRTSTQVRTHAQKFFTKLARTNQVLPYFENQIQKERARLVTQGQVSAGAPTTMMTISAVDAAYLSVTPTSTSVHSYALNTLSPPSKRDFSPAIHNAQRAPPSGYDDQVYGHPRPLMQQAPMPGSYPAVDPSAQLDPYKPRLDSPPSDGAMTRKPARPNSFDYSTFPNGDHMQPPQSSPPYGDHAMMSYTPTSDTYRDNHLYQASSAPGDWNDAGTRAWPQSVDVTSDPTHPGDPDSLPSVTKLLYRGGPSSA